MHHCGQCVMLTYCGYTASMMFTCIEISALIGGICQSPRKADHLLELESGNAAAGSSKMPSSATWDGQLSSPGVVDPWSPKPIAGPTTDPWGMPAPVAQSHPPMPSTVNDPWSASAAPVATSKLSKHIVRAVNNIIIFNTYVDK